MNDRDQKRRSVRRGEGQKRKEQDRKEGRRT